jgi:hypothetical protein
MDFASSFKSKLLDALEDLEEKKMDPVGQADDDIDNDGDVDSSDEYLHKRRKAIKKAMKEEQEARLSEDK